MNIAPEREQLRNRDAYIFYSYLQSRQGMKHSCHQIVPETKMRNYFLTQRTFPCKCFMKAASDCASLSQILLMQCSRPGSAGPLGLCPDCGAP